MLADAERLRQIVWHLLANAVKFTPAGGSVDLSITRDGEQMRLVVADTGRGIPLAFLPNLFERFRQFDGSMTRAVGGLGLALVRHLVTLHGGTVEAASAGNGAGATFTVCLPIAPS